VVKRSYRFFPVVLSLFVAVLFLFAGSVLITGGVLMADDDGGSGTVMYKEDFNGDGKTNIVDAIAFLILGRDDPGNPDVDYNGDGVYNISDVIALIINIHNGNLTPAELYTVSGRALENGLGLQGVVFVMNAEGFYKKTSTDVDGNFQFDNVPNGTYELKPIIQNFAYVFEPEETEVTVSGESITVSDFEATLADFTLSGKIVEDAVGLSDVSIQVVGFGIDTTVVTGSDGIFSVEHLFNAPYTVVPSKENYTFDPYSLAVTMDEDQTIQDITATPTGGTAETLYNVTGRVYCAVQGLSNVTVVLSGDMEASTVTDANGDYIFMVPNGVYTVVSLPIPLYQLFNPSSYNAVVEGADVTDLDFFGFGSSGGL